MNLSFTSALLFTIILPGLIFYKTLITIDGEKEEYKPFNDGLIYVLIPVFIIHSLLLLLFTRHPEIQLNSQEFWKSFLSLLSKDIIIR